MALNFSPGASGEASAMATGLAAMVATLVLSRLD